MGRKALDLTGQVFGRLTVVRRVENSRCGSTRWECVCNCGGCTTAFGTSLKTNHTQSCGCMRIERAKLATTKHGKRGTPEYDAWHAMRRRCGAESLECYKNYGGRGITVCPEWSSFEQFYADMGDRPSEKHSLDRIDNNGNYCKDNCRWATKDEQENNKRSSKLLSFNGETRTITQWSRLLGISVSVIRRRLSLGWSIPDTLTTSVRRR